MWQTIIDLAVLQNALKINVPRRRNWWDFIISHLIFITNFQFSKFPSHYLYQTGHADEIHNPFHPFWQSIYNWSTINIFTALLQAERNMWEKRFCTCLSINVWNEEHRDMSKKSGIWVFLVFKFSREIFSRQYFIQEGKLPWAVLQISQANNEESGESLNTDFTHDAPLKKKHKGEKIHQFLEKSTSL